MHPQHELTNQQRLRIRQGIEIAVFLAFAISFYNYGPFWMTANAINLPLTMGFTFMLFVCYLAFRSQSTRAVAVTAGEETDLESSQADDKPAPFDRRTYRVPRKFGIGSIIVLTMLMALITTGLRSLGARPAVVLATMGLIGIICLMQAAMDRVPRAASCFAGILFGCVVIPMSPMIWEFVEMELKVDVVSQTAQIMIGGILGAGLGYLGGTLAAGVVLAGDLLTEWWQGRTLQFSR